MEAPVVLLVNRFDEDQYLLRLALLHRNLNCDLRHLHDGREAIDYLNGTSQYGDRETFPFPVATILDYQLPCRSGFDVLTWARKQAHLKHHAFVMLSGSAQPLEKERASSLGAARCFDKSAELNDLVDFLDPLLPRLPEAKAA